MRDDDIRDGLRLVRKVRDYANIGRAGSGRTGSMNRCQEYNYNRAVAELLAHARVHYADALTALAQRIERYEANQTGALDG